MHTHTHEFNPEHAHAHTHTHTHTHIQNTGDIMFFDAQLLHNGAAYDEKGTRRNNLFLRIHLYLHWLGGAQTDNIRSVHFKEVRS